MAWCLSKDKDNFINLCFIYLFIFNFIHGDRDSAVGIATDYGLDDRGV
jgi:hypothetical protein